MCAHWTNAQKAGVIAAASLPTGYAWIRWKYPHLGTDVQYFLHMMKIMKTMQKYMKNNTSIVDLFEENVRARPHHPCVLYEQEAYTYAEVAGNVNRTARWVSGSDPSLKKGDTICVMLHNGPTIVWTWLALQKKCFIASMINCNLIGSALLHCIRASESKHIIFGSEFLDTILEIKSALQELHVGLWMINDARIPGLLPPDDVVTMEIYTVSGEHFPSVPMTSIKDTSSYIFTSGTTGLPKPAYVDHAKTVGGSLAPCIYSDLSSEDVFYISLPMYHSSALLLAMCASLNAGLPKPAIVIHGKALMASLLPTRFDLSSDDTFYISLPIYHSSALLIAVCGSLNAGATMAIAKKFSASRYWDDVRRFRASVILYIGEICRYLLAQPKKATDGKYPRPVRAALGNGLRLDVWKDFQTRFSIGQIYEFYAATEGIFSFVNIDGHIGSVGRYSSIMRMMVDRAEIVDYDPETGEPKRGPDGLCIRLPRGSAGLMLHKNTQASSFAGYRGREEMSKKKIVRDVKMKGDSYFNSGDLMKIDVDNYVYFVDRLGDTFRWKGENVSTMEVSHVLSSFPSILEANVYGVHIPGHDGKAGMASIVLHKGAILDLHALYEHITSSLPDYARPKFLRFLAEMEITGTFKHKKTDLSKRGFAPDGYGEVYIIEPSKKTFEPISDEHIKMITAGHSKL